MIADQLRRYPLIRLFSASQFADWLTAGQDYECESGVTIFLENTPGAWIYLVVTGRVQDLILDPEETGKITEVISEGEYYGMRTFDQSLLGYVMEGKIAEDVALDYASSPHDFKLMLAAGGKGASGIEQLTAEPVQ